MSGLLGLVVLVLDIVAILNAIKSSLTTGKKVLWIIIILVLPLLGMILYFVMGKPKAE